MKKIIDILAIVLPAIIILLGFVRLFSRSKTRNFNGLIMLIAILLLLVGLTRNIFFNSKESHESLPKTLPLAVSKHSDSFNLSLENILIAYYSTTEAFSKNDISAINKACAVLKNALDSLKIDDLQKDTLIYQTALDPLSNAKSELAAIVADPSINEKKGSLNIFSDHLFAFIRTVRYDLAVLYWLECASAFGEDKPGYWISNSKESANPYTKENCVAVKATINFVPADSKKIKNYQTTMSTSG